MERTTENTEISRRQMVKAGAAAGAAFAAATMLPETATAASSSLKGKKFAMVIDLQRCTGCGACSLACKIENNTPDGIFWSNKLTQTFGTYQSTKGAV
jgi:NAD-dependent dihydropyrimidine dehydrogenase PreA subunit